MANELQIFYSSGSKITNAFSGEVRKSIGGVLTATQPGDVLRNLFGTISLKALSDGSTEYRMVFLRNVGVGSDDISNLKLFADVPIVAPVVDPDNLIPAPSTGDKWIVPTGGLGLWLDKDGKQATFNGTDWDFDFAPFGNYRFGFVTPADITLPDDTIITQGFVDLIENVFEAPAGITFGSASSQPNEITIGTGVLNVGDNLGMWIERKVNPFIFVKEDLVLDQGGIVREEIIPLKFTYDTP